MKGLVEVAYLVDNKVVKTTELESNLIVDLAGKTIADAMTTTPSLSAIASASAILDASNYTIQAIAFGKPAASYTRHAHDANLSATVIGDGIVRVLSNQTTNVSSYHSSAVVNPGLAEYSDPIDTRLESNSTNSEFDTLDMGHHLNAIFASATNGYGASAGLIGCWAASSTAGTPVAIVDSASAIIASATFRSPINEAQVMDQSGYMNMVVSSVSAGDIVPIKTIGLILKSAGAGSVSDAGADLRYIFNLSAGDYGMPNLFGGIYSLGLYTLDLPKILGEGNTPPYQFDALANPLRYRLFAKKVFSQDITTGIDNLGTSIMSACSTTPVLGVITELVVTWRIRF